MANRESLKTDVSTHFEFGENWEAYSKDIDSERIASAEAGLLALLPAAQIAGRTFLDIGCGSGLHSLAALNVGAKFVTAIDIDPTSVSTAKATLTKHGESQEFRCLVGNVFDPPFDEGEKFDIVYSWGVLHHTGDMWNAIENAIGLVKPGGKLVIAIYFKTPFCGFWKVEKRLFTRSPRILRPPVIWLFSALGILRILTKGRNPVTYIREYKKFRGMSWYRDQIDWLGGYPYESASAEEITSFVEGHGGKLVKSLNTTPNIGLLGSGCAEYVFDIHAN